MFATMCAQIKETGIDNDVDFAMFDMQMDLTTIATTDALAPVHFPKPTATYVTHPSISVSWSTCLKLCVLYCDAIN